MAKGSSRQAVKLIPYGRQYIDEDDITAVNEVLRSDFITQGPIVKKFEYELACRTNHLFAVATNSGSAALKAIVGTIHRSLDKGEIITSPLTFAATVKAIIDNGFTPVFADIEKETLCISARTVAKVSTEATAAVLYVDYAGTPAVQLEEKDLALTNGGHKILVDAAHSLGSLSDDIGDVSIWAKAYSFHPLKSITTGEGGAVVTDYVDVEQFCRKYVNHGSNAARLIIQDGSNHRMSDINAALGRSQLDKLSVLIAFRREIARQYNDNLSGINGITLPEFYRHSAHHLYVIRLENWRKRQKFMEYLLDRGIETRVHYPLAYKHPNFSWRQHPNQPRCRNAEDAAKRIVSIPIHPMMNKDDITRVVDGVRSAARAIL